MKTLKVFAIAILALLCFATQGRADITLTFDQLPGTLLPVPQGYGGLHWINFDYLDGVNYPLNPSGYRNSVITPNNVAYNAYGDPASFNSIAPFTLISAYFTGAWNNGLEISAVGLMAGDPTPAYSKNFIIDSTGPTLVNFNWKNINEAWFIPSDGIDQGYGKFGEHFAIDNLTLASPVPEPAAVILFGTVTLGMVSMLRRRYC